MKKNIILVISIVLVIGLILSFTGLYLNKNGSKTNDNKNNDGKCTYRYIDEELEYDCITNANNTNELTEIDYIIYDYTPYEPENNYSYLVFLMNNKDYVLVNYDKDGKMTSIKNIVDFTEQYFTTLEFKHNLDSIENLDSYIKYKEFSKEANTDDEDTNGIVTKLLENNDEYKSDKKEYKIKIENNNFYVNNKKVSIKDNNKELKVKKVYITESTDDCYVWSKILILTTNNKLYYYDSDTKKIKAINSNYTYTDVYEVDFRESNMPILVAKTTDNKYYSLIDDKIFNYVYKYNIYDKGEVKDSIYINFDGTMENNHNVSYKVKSIYGNLLLTTDNKLFSLLDINLINDKEVKETYIKNVDSNYYLFVAKFVDDTLYVRYDHYNDWDVAYCTDWYKNLNS